jgi:Na+/phosphate symporter
MSTAQKKSDNILLIESLIEASEEIENKSISINDIKEFEHNISNAIFCIELSLKKILKNDLENSNQKEIDNIIRSCNRLLFVLETIRRIHVEDSTHSK